MKVQLLTYHFSDNYGALFQAYALREWFLRKGIDASFINYHPRYVEEGGAFDQLLNPKQWKKNLTIGYLKATHLYWTVFGSSSQRRAFEDFRKMYLGITGTRFFEGDDLATVVDADLLVCGSDQIWNPSVQKGLDPVYFLAFPGAERTRRIAYAPSFGRSTLDTAYHAEAARLIVQLDAISVREQSGVEIVEQLTGRPAVCVPDPTILLGDFTNLLGPAEPAQAPHVFCYALRTDAVIREVAQRAADMAGAQLISPVSPRQRWKVIGKGIELGPVEWLRRLNQASMVVSNSFHGVALSIILNKPFLAVALPGKKGALNERVRNLLEQTGLLGRVVESVEATAVDRVLEVPIDWAQVNQRLEKMREHGSEYLLEQIQFL